MTRVIISDLYSNHNLPIGAEVTLLDTSDAPDWSDDGVEWYTQGGEGDEVAIDSRDLMKYQHTHVSAFDGSPAMLVSQDETTITLVNEDGLEWTDPRGDWDAIL